MPFAEIIVVGAGPAGLTTALELTKAGHQVAVLERDTKYVGGLARTVDYRHYRFDLGGHRFFSKNSEIGRWWRERLPEDFIRVKRKSRIRYRGRFFDYPLRAGNVLKSLGFLTSCRCILSYLWRQWRPIPNESSFENWVINRFGDRLYRTFFKTYTEKVWGRPCSEISSDWARQRIKGLSLKEAIFNAIRPKGTCRNTPKTLIEEFEYPRLGPGQMWEKAQAEIVGLGGQVVLDQEVRRIGHEENQITKISTISQSGKETEWTGRQYIMSMPLRDCVLSMEPPMSEEVRSAAAQLKYRDFIAVALMVNRSDLFADNWIYIHDPGVRVGRIQNLNNWSKDMVPNPNTTCLELEYFCNQGDATWRLSDPELIELAKGELQQLGFARTDEVIDGCVVRVEKAYPVYDESYQANIATIRKALARIQNLQVVGRNGMHKYNNQDHSMLTGMLAARNVDGGKYDLWRVNTDAEYLESGPSKNDS